MYNVMSVSRRSISTVPTDVMQLRLFSASQSIEFSRLIEQHTHWLEQLQHGNLHDDSLHRLASKLLIKYHSLMVQLRDDIASSLTTYDLHAMVAAMLIVWSVSNIQSNMPLLQ